MQTILLVEDEEDDVFIFRRAVKRARITNPIQIINDGESAIAYLSGAGMYADRTRYPLPLLTLLDLNLPRITGLEVLKWIREQSLLNQMSVIVLTSSAQDRDISRAYHLGARSYLVKPPTPAGLLEVLNALRASSDSASERLRISTVRDLNKLDC